MGSGVREREYNHAGCVLAPPRAWRSRRAGHHTVARPAIRDLDPAQMAPEGEAVAAKFGLLGP
jgi:hypothetical protein